MADLQALALALAQAEQGHDHPEMRAVRERIVAEHEDTPEAAEAAYKIGLDALFRQRDIEAATSWLERATKTREPYWSAAARTSLALCYFHQRRVQKALFELRKVGYVREPSAHSVTALSFIENILLSEGNAAEAQRVRRDRTTQLEALCSAGRTDPARAQERGQYLYQLGLALIDQRERERARTALEEARALGPAILGDELLQNITAALRA